MESSTPVLWPTPNHMASCSSTMAALSPRYIDQCVKSNPRQLVKVDILGDTVELPVYALRRRNALVHI
ncbi:hypothetical protein CLU79DRAFT_762627 [Phycomyces nitens]|nr:hypothetical protein CLU79DRAFT_762627 [Phycomyces nitens]